MADRIAPPFPTSASPLVGREREQALLREALAAALAGRGGLVLIGGEAGIGKTALAEALLREGEAQGALALVGRCYDLTETPPYGPWAELLEQVPADHHRSSLPAPLGGGGAAASQAALFALVRDLLVACAARQPLVLLLDDLHWADPASLELLRFLARRLPASPVLLLLAYRAEEVTRGQPLYQWLPVLLHEAPALRLELRPLEEGDVRALVDERYALLSADADRLVAYLQARAEGNPFYTAELLRTLAEERLLRPLDGGWSLGDLSWVRLPTLLRQVIDRRLGRLGEQAQWLLALAAVIGQETPLDLWAEVAEVEEVALLDAVERAVEAHLLDAPAGGPTVRFAHALIREALYEATLAPRRRAWHRRVAEALAALPAADPDAVASHFQRAGDPRAAAWLIAAGERAQDAYAWLTAAERFEAALAFMDASEDDRGERGWLLLRLGWLRHVADPQRSVAYFDETGRLATAREDAALRAYALFSRGLCQCEIGHIRRGLEELAVGVAALDALPPAERERLGALAARLGLDAQDARGTLALWLALAGRSAEARPLAERVLAQPPAVRAAPKLGGAGYAEAHFALASIHAYLGRPAEARQAYARAREALRTIQDDGELGLTLVYELEQVMLPYHADQVAERRRLAAEAEGLLARQNGVGDAPPRARHWPLLLVEGQWAEARRAALALRTARRVPLSFLAQAQGDAAQAWALVREQFPEGPGALPGNALLFRSLALLRRAGALALDEGDLGAACAWLTAHDRWLAWSGAVLGRAEGHLGWAAYHRAAGALAQACAQAEQALVHAGEPRQPLALLAAHRALGELATAAGLLADAAEHLSQALALADACAVPYERALTLLALAELHGQGGRIAEARVALTEVRAICEPLGTRPALVRAARLEAKLALLRDAAPASPYPAGLTVREVEVLRLVATGRSNRAIAAALSLSVRTVERHIANILLKIDAHSKAEATAYAFRQHLT